MPNSCSAFGCTNRAKCRGVQFFSFPLKNKELLKRWIVSIRREHFTPTKHSRICSDHFKGDDYLVRPGTYIRHLTPDAVPSVFKAFPKHLQPKQTLRRDLKRKLEHSNENVPSKITNCSQIIDTCNMESNELIVVSNKADKGIQTEENATEIKLKSKIKTLQQKIRRQSKRITNFKEMLIVLKNKNLIEQEAENLLVQRFQGTTLDIFKSELRNGGRNAKGFRYSSETKRFALTLHYYSPKAYEFCRTIFSLPHKSSLTNWTSSINAEPGFFTEVFSALSNFEEADRDCLAFDVNPIGGVFEITWTKRTLVDIGTSDEGDDDEGEFNKLKQYGNFNKLGESLLDTTKENILYYIGGYIVRGLLKKIDCVYCADNLTSTKSEHDYVHNSKFSLFTDMKYKGGLICISECVFKIIKATEAEIIILTNN